MKVLLRRMFSCPPVERWRAFEGCLIDCLRELGQEVTPIDLDPEIPADPAGYDFFIYCHKTRREVPHAHLFYKEMHMQGLFTIDHEGWGADHSVLRQAPDLSGTDAEQARAACLAMRSEFLMSGRSKHRQPSMRSIDSRLKPYYFAPLQLPTDDVIMYHSPLSIIEYVNTLSDWAERTGKNVVFKIHPGSPFPEIASAVRLRADSKRVFLLDENIHTLIAESNGVITINSGVGFESLIHGKPVATLGSCDYQWVTFRATPSTLDQATNYMDSYNQEQQALGYRFIHFYYHRHAYLAWPEMASGAQSRLQTYLRNAIFARGLASQQSSGGHGE